MEMCNDCLKNLVANFTAKNGTRLNPENFEIQPYTEIFNTSGLVGEVFQDSTSVFFYGDIIFTSVEDTSILIGETATTVQTDSNLQFQNLLFSKLSDGGTATGIFVGKKITANARI